MKINPAAAYGIYKANSNTQRHDSDTSFAGQLESLSAKKAEHTDQVSISAEGARQMEAERATRSIMSSIDSPTPPQKLEELRAAVQNKTYYVSTGDLVDAVMQRWFGI